MNQIYEKAKSNPKVMTMLIITLALSVLVACAVINHAWQKHADSESRLQQATVLTQQQAQDKNVLQNKLDMSKQNAEMLAEFAKKALEGQAQPINHFTVQAPSLPVATQQVADRIKAKDPTLPPQALAKTDNTIVTPNTNKTPQANYNVAVFKNNNYRNWEWSVGYGWQDGSRYIPVGLQRNYSKDKAIEAEVHLDSDNIKKVNGAEIKHVWKTDKLFFFF